MSPAVSGYRLFRVSDARVRVLGVTAARLCKVALIAFAALYVVAVMSPAGDWWITITYWLAGLTALCSGVAWAIDAAASRRRTRSTARQ